MVRTLELVTNSESRYLYWKKKLADLAYNDARFISSFLGLNGKYTVRFEADEKDVTSIMGELLIPSEALTLRYKE